MQNPSDQPSKLARLPPLDYASQPLPWYRRRSLQHAGAGLLAVAVFVAGIFVARVAWEQYRLRRAWADFAARQQQCLSYVAAPDFIACTDDPAAFQRLLAREGYQRRGGVDPDVPFVGYEPRVLRQFREFQVMAGFPVVFLHERRSPDGTQFLVAVHVRGIRLDGDCMLVADVADVAQPPDVPQFLSPRSGTFISLHCKPDSDRHIVFTAGQTDPADPSHFTIGYRFAGHAGVIDGRIADGGSVNLTTQAAP